MFLKQHAVDTASYMHCNKYNYPVIQIQINETNYPDVY